jgi:putative transposase
LVHLVWIPKYRKRVLQGSLLIRLDTLLRQAADINRWQIQELAIQPDHVHLLLQIHPRESIASVVKTLKGGTSRVLRSEYPELEEFLWGQSFWAEGYFAETVGQVKEAIVSQYIRRQRQG